MWPVTRRCPYSCLHLSHSLSCAKDVSNRTAHPLVAPMYPTLSWWLSWAPSLPWVLCSSRALPRLFPWCFPVFQSHYLLTDCFLCQRWFIRVLFLWTLPGESLCWFSTVQEFLEVHRQLPAIFAVCECQFAVRFSEAQVVWPARVASRTLRKNPLRCVSWNLLLPYRAVLLGTSLFICLMVLATSFRFSLSFLMFSCVLQLCFISDMPGTYIYITYWYTFICTYIRQFYIMFNIK